MTHNIAEDCSTASHQCTRDDKEIIFQHEPSRSRSPPRITIEHGNHHRHIRTPNRNNQVHAQNQRYTSYNQQGNKSGIMALIEKLRAKVD